MLWPGARPTKKAFTLTPPVKGQKWCLLASLVTSLVAGANNIVNAMVRSMVASWYISCINFIHRLMIRISHLHTSLHPTEIRLAMTRAMIYYNGAWYLVFTRYILLFLLPLGNVSYMIWSDINRICSSTPVFSFLSLWDSAMGLVRRLSGSKEQWGRGWPTTPMARDGA